MISLKKKLLMVAGGVFIQQQTDTLPAMTSNTSPTGHVASTSSTSSGATQPWRAFNKSDGLVDFSMESPNTGWLQRKTPTSIRVWKFGITNREGSVNQAPRDFTLSGSNDGVNFTTLATVINQIDWATQQVRYFEVPKANRRFFAYHRLTITANNGSSATSLNEISLLQEVRK